MRSTTPTVRASAPEPTVTVDDPDLQRVLEQVPELRHPSATVTPITGGITNRNYRVVSPDGDYVVRVSVRETGLLGIDRDNEKHNSLIAAAANVGAPVIARVLDPEALVVGYLPSVTLAPEDFRDPRRISVLATQLRRLHAAPPFAQDFDMVAVQRRYHGIAVENGYPLPEDYSAYADRARTIGELLTRTRTATAPCHNDLMPGNFLETDGPGSHIWIVDYEYSGNNDPIYDLGDAINELELDPGQAERLVTEYHGRSCPQQLARARLWSLMSQYGWSLWASIRIGTTGDPEIIEWAMALWHRAVAAFDSPEFETLLERAAEPDEPT